ncbi:MAG TPA: FAD-binding oxidoreductase [Paracoccaceae bacterium]|nr:FAD-binding oxidoreductase [Paracoccaceae bacterium]
MPAAPAVPPHPRALRPEAGPALACHASGRSAALYEPRYGNPAVVALSLASGDALRAIPGVLSPRGILLVADEDSAETGRTEANAMQLAPVTADAALAILPILNPATLAFAAHATHAWDIDTDLLIQTLARQARAAGARIVTGTPVTGIVRQGAGWRVVWAGGSATAGVIVNAAGAWADRVAVMAGVAPLGLRPLRRSMARIPAPAGYDVSRWPMTLAAGESWYMKPDAGALIVSPAEEDAVAEPHDAFADDMVLAEGLARYEAAVTAPVTRMLANWAGLRTFAPDRVPSIGFAPDSPGFFWLAGQGGYGFQTAPAAAALAADLLTGRAAGLPADLVAALTPGRFGPG